MNEKLLQKYLLHLCFCVVACAYAALSVAAENSDPVHAALKGRWEGTLNGAFRSQDVSWHFETDEKGVLKGYMGPSSAGMPERPMENLVVGDGRLSFSLASQHASFSGELTRDGVTGTWLQGAALPLQMRKKNFVFPLSASVRSELVGAWQLQNGGTTVELDFSEAADGSVVGFLSIPLIDLHDAPLVDIFVTDDGFAQFATDNGRRFTGRLVNGVLVGEYFASGARYRRNFLRVGDQREDYELTLTDETRQRMLGRWRCEVLGDDVVMEIIATADGPVHGRLLFDEGPRRSDKLLELQVEGSNVSYTSFEGRTFTGSFTDEGIAGDYVNNGRAFGVLYARDAN